MRLVHNGPVSVTTMRLVHSVSVTLWDWSGTIWNWFTMGLLVLHYETGSQWTWYNMKLVHNGPVSVTLWDWFATGLVHCETGSQWTWYTWDWFTLCYETGSWDWFTLCYETGSWDWFTLCYETGSWDWFTLCYETGSQWAWYNMRLVHNGPVSVQLLHCETGTLGD